MSQMKRVIRYGYSNFTRNRFITISTVFIMTTTLFVIGLSLLGNALLNDVSRQAQEQVDITVYFKPGALEDSILGFRDNVKQIEGVSSVDYISQGEALAEYRQKNIDDEILLEGLEQLDENPLRARLHIHSDNVNLYKGIAESIQNKEIVSNANISIIDKINFFENEELIDKLNAFIESATLTIILVISVLVISAFVITFMTERITMHSNKEEIQLMYLIGAGKFYSTAPFIVEGIMYGVSGAIAAVVLLYPFALWAGPLTEGFFGGLSLLSYYGEWFFYIFGVLLLLGVLISTISTAIVVTRYSK